MRLNGLLWKELGAMLSAPPTPIVRLNAYDDLAAAYQPTDHKPDKLFSMLPTVLALAGECYGTIVDIGCGSGFFTKMLATLGAKEVIGIDDSYEQIKHARETYSPPSVEYAWADAFTDPLPKADLVICPFVLNYAQHSDELRTWVQHMFDSLRPNGRLISIVDLPTGKDLRRFGAVKTLLGPEQDGTEIRIDLYDRELLCTLHAIYFTQATLERSLYEVGFENVQWHTPIVSDEGIRTMPPGFWNGYVEEPELGYVTALRR